MERSESEFLPHNVLPVERSTNVVKWLCEAGIVGTVSRLGDPIAKDMELESKAPKRTIVDNLFIDESNRNENLDFGLLLVAYFDFF